MIAKNVLTGVRDFSDRCAWKVKQHTMHPEAGIILGRAVRNSEIGDNVVRNFGAEGISLDISITDQAFIDLAPDHNSIEGNSVSDVGRSGLDVNGGNSNRFADNTVLNANLFHLRGGNATYIRGGSGNQFINNSITGFGLLIAVSGSTAAKSLVMPSNGNVVSGNHLTYLGLGTGLADPSIRDCDQVENVPDYGAEISGAPDTSI